MITKIDISKPPIALLIMEYPTAFNLLGLGRVYGNVKYGISSLWRYYDGNKKEYQLRILNSILRHLQTPFDFDVESGLPHLLHALTQMLIYAEFSMNYNFNDRTNDPLIPFKETLNKKTTTISKEEDWKKNWSLEKSLLLSKKHSLAIGDVIIDFRSTISTLSLQYKRLSLIIVESGDLHELFNRLVVLVIEKTKNISCSEEAITEDHDNKLLPPLLGLYLLERSYSTFDIDFFFKTKGNAN